MDVDQDGGGAPRTGAPWRSLLAVGGIAVLLRVAYTLALARHVELGISDAGFYSEAANHLAAGDGYIDVWRSLARGETLRTAHHPPGWPALLSIGSLLGVDTTLGHRLVGALLGAVVVVLLGYLAWRVAGRTAGLVAAGLAAVHPTLLAADGSLMAETLAGALLVVVVLVALRVVDAPGPWGSLLLGLAIGGGALVRGEGLLLLVLVGLPVALVVAHRSPDGVRTFLRIGVPIAAGVVAVVLPWTVRNTLLFDEVVLISINDSTVLAGANCAASYREPGIGSWSLDCLRHDIGGTEVEEAAIWREQGNTYLREHRDRLPAVVAARLARTWGVREVLAPSAEGRHLGTQTAGNVAWLGVLLPGGVLGAVVLARRRRPVALWLLLAPVASATSVTVLGFGMVRFRHPIELSAVVLTAVAVAALRDRRRGAGGTDADCAPLTPCPHSAPGR